METQPNASALAAASSGDARARGPAPPRRATANPTCGRTRSTSRRGPRETCTNGTARALCFRGLCRLRSVWKTRRGVRRDQKRPRARPWRSKKRASQSVFSEEACFRHPPRSRAPPRRRVAPFPLFPLPFLRPRLQRSLRARLVHGLGGVVIAVVRVAERAPERLEEAKGLRRLVLRRGNGRARGGGRGENIRVAVPSSFAFDFAFDFDFDFCFDFDFFSDFDFDFDFDFFFFFFFDFFFFVRRRVRFISPSRRAGLFVRRLSRVGVFGRLVLAGLRLAVRARRGPARRRRRRVPRARASECSAATVFAALAFRVSSSRISRASASRRRRGPGGVLRVLRRARGGGERTTRVARTRRAPRRRRRPGNAPPADSEDATEDALVRIIGTGGVCVVF